jgi:polyhydroxyalkanoate synthesis regulator phasin
MAQEAWRAYLEMALGMTETSRKKATKAVKRVLGRGGATAEQLQGLAEELLRTSAANREALTKLVRFELDRALGRVGLATADEVNELTARVRDLEAQLRDPRTGATASGNGVAGERVGAGDAVVVTVPPARKVAKKAVPAKAVPAKAAPVKKAVAKKAVAKKTVAKKAVPARSSTGRSRIADATTPAPLVKKTTR